eukprot:CAMPEP_0185285176 /NCGR_PEP_ID=MMETSP1363-20130426/1553_1 /TAXON_ID=38817 /ORGANISM="Gephyrocapsa oceanica, Strain RCC1303" /LENGTH=37 /DNA_ID= /DNA_START= /DNA_END= /DNA_ORIENTATION=
MPVSETQPRRTDHMRIVPSGPAAQPGARPSSPAPASS